MDDGLHLNQSRNVRIAPAAAKEPIPDMHKLETAAGGPHHNQILWGLGLRLAASALLASMAALVKLAEQRGATVIETMFFRQACAVPIVTAWIVVGPGLRSIGTRRLLAQAWRTAVGIASMGASFAALLLLPLAEANTLQFTVPIFATIMGALILSEPTGWHRWGAVLISFAGVLIVTQPGSGSLPPLGAAIGLTAACLTAVSAILLRQIGQTESASTTVFWFSLMSVPPLGLLYAFNLRAHDLTTWTLLAGIGVVGAATQLAGTASVRFAPVSAVIPMDYSSLIWSVSYGWLLFGTFPGATTWIGAAVIAASALYITHREYQIRQRAADPPHCTS